MFLRRHVKNFHPSPVPLPLSSIVARMRRQIPPNCTIISRNFRLYEITSYTSPPRNFVFTRFPSPSPHPSPLFTQFADNKLAGSRLIEGNIRSRFPSPLFLSRPQKKNVHGMIFSPARGRNLSNLLVSILYVCQTCNVI